VVGNQARSKFFDVAKTFRKGPELHVVVGPQKTPRHALPAAEDADPEPAGTARLRFDTLQMRRRRSSTAASTDILDPVLYGALAQSFPSATLFQAHDGRRQQEAHAWRAQQRAAVRRAYRRASGVAGLPRVHQIAAFLDDVRAALQPHGVTLPPRTRFRPASNSRGCRQTVGSLLPHTDLPEKLVTIVIGMRRDGDGWDDAFGGGTLMLRPKPGTDRRMTTRRRSRPSTSSRRCRTRRTPRRSS
jgi:hypothetical protein